MSERVTRETAAGRAYLDLRRLAKANGRATDEYLRLYALEGFLARLAASPHRDGFVVKGGALLAAFDVRRPTADVDLAGLMTSNDVESVQALVSAIALCEPTTEDGLEFGPAVSAAAIREEDAYAGVRVSLTANLATARLALHVDVNVGDPIWSGPSHVALPRLLGGEIAVLGYPLAMVLAEKLVTASQRGAANTRWRDFADVYALTRIHEFEAGDVHSAVRVVAAHRGVAIRPLREGLAGYADAGQSRWTAWRARQHLDDRLPAQFSAVVDQVLRFADGCFHQLTSETRWSPVAQAWR